MSDDLAQTEVERMVANMIRVGKITELDEKNARVKVETAGVTTDWLPFGASRAGETREWNPPEKDEQVLLFCPYGDLGQAVVGHSIYQDKFKAPGDKKNITNLTYKDGTTVSYDREKHEYTMKMHESGKFTVNAGDGTMTMTKDSMTFSIGGVKITTDKDGVKINGKVTIDSDVKIDGKITAGSDVSVSGGVTAQGDVKAGPISLSSHKHPTPMGMSGSAVP